MRKAFPNDAKIEVLVFDENASVMDGSMGMLPRRLMVADDDFVQAQRILREGLAAMPPKPARTRETYRPRIVFSEGS